MENLSAPNEMLPFVKEIIFFDSNEKHLEHDIPFYADGFAGIVFSKSDNPFTIYPQKKLLPDFYLYGQTIIPMSLKTVGRFEVFAIRLYPFAVKLLLNVDTKILNDDCFNLRNVKNIDTQQFLTELNAANDKAQIVKLLSEYFEALLKNAASNPDHRVVLATNLILKSNGTIQLSEIRERLHVTERTLERQFLKETGVTAIQFAKIIQFQSTVKLITEKDYITLTDIGYQSGYADQSHFIRSFKKYAGKTPKEFQQHLSI